MAPVSLSAPPQVLLAVQATALVDMEGKMGVSRSFPLGCLGYAPG